MSGTAERSCSNGIWHRDGDRREAHVPAPRPFIEESGATLIWITSAVIVEFVHRYQQCADAVH
jgi:hypothetical protein